MQPDGSTWQLVQTGFAKHKPATKGTLSDICDAEDASISPAVPLKLKKLPPAKWTNCSHLQWKLSEISWACMRRRCEQHGTAANPTDPHSSILLGALCKLRTSSEVYLCEVRLIGVGKHPARLHITHLWVIYQVGHSLGLQRNKMSAIIATAEVFVRHLQSLATTRRTRKSGSGLKSASKMPT